MLTPVFLSIKKEQVPVLKDHPQVSWILDNLYRKQSQPIALFGQQEHTVQYELVKSLAWVSTFETPVKKIQPSLFIYFDVQEFSLRNFNPDELKHYFEILIEKSSSQKIIFALNQSHVFENQDPASALGCLKLWLTSFFYHDNWRFLVFTNPSNTVIDQCFKSTFLSQPSAFEFSAILKEYKTKLEERYQVYIPEETITSALSLAQHYLYGTYCVEKSLELLESACLRMNSKETVTTFDLIQVVSHWTQIPAAHLQQNKFHAVKFIEGVQRQFFGQDNAVKLIGTVLQNACVKLQEKKGPLCAFLFAGAKDTGKTTMASLLAEQLFGSKKSLLRINLSSWPIKSLQEIRVQTDPDTYPMNLLDAVKKIPYAVLLIENIHHAPPETLALFQPVLQQGHVVDTHGQIYYFQHTILIMTTTVGSERIYSLTQPSSQQDHAKPVDLMQLVLNTNINDHEDHQRIPASAAELSYEILPLLAAKFPAELLDCLHIVPFIPLDYLAIEKIINSKIKALTKQLETLHAIDLTTTPEVIKFLAHEMLWQKNHGKTIEHVLEQNLYSCLAHEILALNEDKTRSKRLILRLHENGCLVKCVPAGLVSV